MSEPFHYKLQQALKGLAIEAEKSTASYEAQIKATRERFNVFTTVLDERDEVRLHTRFLHCLLDPEGSHDCGTLFIDLFFETLRQLGGSDNEGKPVPFEVYSASKSWEVRKEHTHPELDGQIDLLLTTNNHIVAIENKTRKGETDRQLARYSEFLTQQHKPSLLLFLTPDGWKSKDDEDTPYVRISYKEHILPWLEACLRATYQFPPINQVLIQYRAVVRQITNTNPDPRLMEPNVKFILDNPSLVQHQATIQTAITEAKTKAWKNLSESLALSLAQCSQFEITATDADTDRPSIQMKLKGDESSFPFEVWLELDGVGICVDNIKPDSDQQRALDAMHTLLKTSQEDWLEHTFHEADKKRFPIGWHKTAGGSHDEIYATIMRLGGQTRICDEVSKYLDLLLSCWSEEEKG